MYRIAAFDMSISGWMLMLSITDEMVVVDEEGRLTRPVQLTTRGHQTEGTALIVTANGAMHAAYRTCQHPVLDISTRTQYCQTTRVEQFDQSLLNKTFSQSFLDAIEGVFLPMAGATRVWWGCVLPAADQVPRWSE
jgi:hypothetical protein